MYAGLWSGSTMLLAGVLSVAPIVVGWLRTRGQSDSTPAQSIGDPFDLEAKPRRVPPPVDDESASVAPGHISTYSHSSKPEPEYIESSTGSAGGR